MTRKTVHKALAAALAASLSITTVGLSISVPAYAEPSSSELQAQLDDARARLSELESQAAEASEALNDTKYQLEETKKQIEQTEQEIKDKEAELQEAQDVLAERVAANYKSGGVSLLEIVLQSSSFDELTNNIYYAQKVTESDEAAINEVKQVKQELADKQSQLEQQKSEQEALVEQQEQQQATLEAEASEAESYVNSLDSQVQEALAAEQAAAEAEAQRQAQQAQQEAEQNGGNYYVPDNSGGGSTGGGGGSTGGGGGGSVSGGGGGGGSVSSGGLSSSQRNTIVSAAYSMVGGNYVYGAYNPGSRTFDCSGLTMYCYACAGISIPHSSGAQAAYCNTPASQAVAGDIVWRSGHVGICIGGGQTIEAMSPSQGITFGSVYDFALAGSPS